MRDLSDKLETIEFVKLSSGAALFERSPPHFLTTVYTNWRTSLPSSWRLTRGAGGEFPFLVRRNHTPLAISICDLFLFFEPPEVV